MKKINFKLIILFTATLGLLVFLHLVGALSPLSRGLAIVLNPVTAKLQSWSTGLRWQYEERVRQGDLSAELSDLKKQVEELMIKNASLKKAEEENSNLRQHLKFLESGDKKKYVLADVVSREVFSGSKENSGDMIINKGSDEGIVKGAVVLNEQGAVVGKITEAKEKISRFVLATNSACKFAAALQNSSRTIGVTSGNLGLTIDMDYIPQMELVSAGDLVVTSGLEAGIPRGLVIGQVAEVNKSGNEIWQSANIQPLADFEALMIVSVLVP
jgi:rod shape-determining protein MreC